MTFKCVYFIKPSILISSFTEHNICNVTDWENTYLVLAFPVVKNCFSKAVLFCVPAQVTTHTHYLLMQLTCTCLAWHGPYHLCFQFLISAVRSKSGRIGQGVGTGSTAEFGKRSIPKWFDCSLQFLKFLIFNRELYRVFFFAISPLFPYGENLSISPAERWAEI